MAGERVLQATAVIDLQDLASGKLEKLAKKLVSLDRLTKMIGKTDGFASFDRQAQGIEKAANAISHLERQVANLTRLDAVAGDMNKIAQAVERLDRASERGAASNRKLRESMSFADRAAQMGMIAGPAVLAATHRAWHAGADLVHTEVQMRQAGMGPQEIARARTLAGRLAKDMPTLSVAELMELHRETRSSVRHTEEAFELMPELAKAKAAMRGAGIPDTGLAEIVKAGESLGLMSDPERFKRFLEGQVKAMQWFGKTIDTTQIFEASKYSKSAGSTLSDEFINTALPSLIQEMHGSSAGDALSMLVKTLRGGMQNKHIPVERLNELGLLADPDQIVRTKTGSIKGYKGRVVGDDLLASNPFQWFDTVFREAARKKGITELADLVRLLNQTLPGTAANLGRIFLQQAETIRAHAAGMNAEPGLDKQVENLRDDPTAQMRALGDSIENFAGVLASPIMKDAAHVMDGLARTIGNWQESLTEFQKQHPDAAKWIGGGALALGGTAGAAGTYGLISGLINGFGLKGSAAALDASAAALTSAAGKLGVAGAASGAAATGASAAGGAAAGGILGRLGLAFRWFGGAGAAAAGAMAADAGIFYVLDNLGGDFSGRSSAKHHRRGWIDEFEDWLDREPPRGSRQHAEWARRHRGSDYSTGGGFGDESPEVRRALDLERFGRRSGRPMEPPSGSVWDYSLSGLIHPEPSFPMPIPRPDRPVDTPIPIPRPSEAERAGFDDIRGFPADLESALKSGLSGTATVTIEARPGPMLEPYVRGIVKSELKNIDVTGPGSVGTDGTNIDQHN